ncbi:uncharacterized protein LOC125474540 [Pyrus x bretschneideri]|uniref:uncharacterized protein LOC125474540 n=1 Tax=Pyrus x bretschneideri TaxID=225117 RepID=UPI0020304AC4|nr:uncharacterized protein LOC125474540 [Pyrus x bretschneideri]
MGDKSEKSTSSSMTLYQKWENPNHPLYLHHSDQPGAILMPQPLVEDNYGTWVQSMTMALMVKNKLGLVDGTIKKPSDEQIEELQQWNRCNNLVKTWLLGSMSKEISGSVIHCKDARKLKSLWDDRDALCSIPAYHCETKRKMMSYVETQKTMKFLMGLNESYATVRGNTLLLEPLPTVNKAYALVL